MFNRQAVGSLKTEKGEDNRPRFGRRGGVSRGNVATPSPAKSFVSFIVLAFTPSRKASRFGRKSVTKTSTSNCNAPDSSDTSNATLTGCKNMPSSYAEALLQNDNRTLASTISPLSLSSLESNVGISHPPSWTKITQNEVVATATATATATPSAPHPNNGEHWKSPVAPTQIPLPTFFSPIATITPPSRIFHRLRSHSSLAGMSMAPNSVGSNNDSDGDLGRDSIAQDTNQLDSSRDIAPNYSYYNFDLNHDYDFDLDDDLATERHRYLKGKNIHIDGVEMSVEEEEFIKSFNRIKLDRRQRRK